MRQHVMTEHPDLSRLAATLEHLLAALPADALPALAGVLAAAAAKVTGRLATPPAPTQENPTRLHDPEAIRGVIREFWATAGVAGNV